MTKIKEFLDVALKTVILVCVIVALCNTIRTRKDVSDVAGELSTYKFLISQPIDEDGEINCKGDFCDTAE